MDEKNELPAEEQEKLVEHRNRMRFDWDNLIEDLIEEGKQRGAFDNLPGKGKPLNLSKNPYEAENELAYKLLKENDLKPVWLMNRHEIQEAVKRLRAEIKRTWARHEQEFRLAQGKAQQGGLVISWDNACQKWEAEIVKINKKIDDFNLKRPVAGMELFKLLLKEELARAGARRWL